jgi:hypothetical protein
MWRQSIVWPEKDPILDAIFAAIVPAAMEVTARPHKEFKLKRRSRISLDSDQSQLVLIYKYVSVVLGIIPAELYILPRQPASLLVANTTKAPSVIVDQRMLNRSEKELAFLLGQQLTYLRPENILSRLFPSAAQIRTIALAAMKLGHPHFPLQPGEDQEVHRVVELLSEPGRIHSTVLQQLVDLVQKFVRSQTSIDLSTWLRSLTLTADRVGLIICNDLLVAARAISEGPTTVGAPPTEIRIQELITYGTSERYFYLRRDLQTNIGSR